MKPSEVKAYRKENNLTQKQLAEKLGCSKRTVESWEGGKIEKFSLMGQKMWDQILEKSIKDSLEVIGEYDKKFGPKDRTIHELLEKDNSLTREEVDNLLS